MKHTATYLIGVFLLALTTLSCSKEGHEETRQQASAAPQMVQANLSADQTYSFSLGTGSTASIKTQAQHYQISEIATAPNGNTVYRYIPLKSYAGADEVTLQQTITSTVQSGGCAPGHTNSRTTTMLKTIVLKFNIAN
jgi:hypothetical protein